MATENSISFPYEIVDAESEPSAATKDKFSDVQDDVGYVRVGPKGYFFPKLYLNEGPAVYNMETRPGQVFVGGYPRSGTTWTQQIVWLIIHDLDYAENEKISMQHKFNFLEKRAVLSADAIKNQIKKNKGNDYNEENILFDFKQIFNKVTPSHLYFKTHLPLSLLPPALLDTSKMVYIARDPRDTIVSFFHLSKGGLWLFKKDFKTMWNFFIKDTLVFCPYFEHVKEFWEKRHNPNLLFLFYEDVKNDRLNTLRRVADFFNKSYTEEQLLAASRYLDFSNLKNEKSFNHSFLKEYGLTKPDAQPFIRKGIVGGWREYFDEEMSRQAEQWIADNLRDTDLRFPTINID